jgi:hypothetical protein
MAVALTTATSLQATAMVFVFQRVNLWNELYTATVEMSGRGVQLWGPRGNK